MRRYGHFISGMAAKGETSQQSAYLTIGARERVLLAGCRLASER
jgi:hypothetical protein